MYEIYMKNHMTHLIDIVPFPKVNVAHIFLSNNYLNSLFQLYDFIYYFYSSN